MKKRTKYNLKSNLLFYIILSIMLIIILIFSIKLYIDHINRETNKILENTETSILSKKSTLLNNGLNKIDIKKDLLEKTKNKKINTITYKIDGEKFYLDVTINDEKNSITINKIVDELHNVNAKMNLNNIETIEFRTGNSNNATLLHLITEYDDEYFIMTENTYYFLGTDIESISYINDHFYYVSYNPSYKSLENIDSCTNEVKNSISGFNTNHYYYRYGKINFLKDYYQKLSTNTYTVKDKCNELEKNKQEVTK